MPRDFEKDDGIHDVAMRTYAILRGSVRYPLPEHLALTWDDLPDDVRSMYVSLTQAGYDACGNL